MKEEIRIAWRNLWRNHRRTLITSASVFFAVFFAVVMRSIQLGSYNHMINNVIESFTGFLQVQHEDFHDSPTLENSFEYDASMMTAISGLEDVVSVTPQLESFTLASNGLQTKGVMVMGIDPERERHFSDPEQKLVKYRITEEAVAHLEEGGHIPESLMKKVEENLGRSYSSSERLAMELSLSPEDDKELMQAIGESTREENAYLETDDEGILIGDKLAGFLKVEAGDSVILMGQGYRGVSATGIFPVRGIMKVPSPELDNKLVVMSLPAAQKLFGAGGRVTSLVVNLTGKSDRTVNKARESINGLLEEEDITTMTWYELNPILHQQIEGDNQSGIAMLIILYFIIFFGIFGTVLMMVSERKREFGVLVAIGMQKKKLERIIAIEMLLLGALGLAAGLLASAPVILYFYYNPLVLTGDIARMMADWGWEAVMPTAWFGAYYFWQAGIVALMVLLATIYPLRKIGKLEVVEALKA